jgi:hypothetical protein
MICVLPAGLVVDGVRHREAELRGLSGREEELLAAAVPGAAAVTAVLARCLSRIGAVEPVDAALVRGLLVADRQVLLLRLREATFGELVRGSVPCPWPDCGTRVAVSFSTGDVPVVEAAEPGPVFHRTLSAEAMPGRGEHEREVSFRLPVGADQEALGATAARSEAEALTGLLAACLLTVGGVAVDAELVADLSPRARSEIEEYMASLAPRVELVMDARCTACGRGFEVPFDLQAFFFGELTVTADMLRREVHHLAFHYHWSEREILEMGRERRRGYLDVLADELERLDERV